MRAARSAMKAACPGDLEINDPDTIARDLLPDLRDFCAVRTMNFDQLVSQSKRHYAREALVIRFQILGK
jgi:hypothetical protein